jgi:hypothetical protein
LPIINAGRRFDPAGNFACFDKESKKVASLLHSYKRNARNKNHLWVIKQNLFFLNGPKSVSFILVRGQLQMVKIPAQQNLWHL